ncbi:hypothetical protein ACQP1V_31780 [Microtetraspora malaysiensis]|uniref:hypothetical protein n=1 Tax=Microtetraspora malaysiensis TaxID=161358 RepID=UPI003D89D706
MLRPGGTYFAQYVGPKTMFELIEFFLGPPAARAVPQTAPGRESRTGAGGRLKIMGVGAVVYFLHKVIWTVPHFTVERYRDRLHERHEKIEAGPLRGPLVPDPHRGPRTGWS